MTGTVERRYQTFWPRFWASVIDGLLFWPLTYLTGFVYDSTHSPLVVYAAFVLDAAALMAYSVCMHARFGQTIGKWIMKVQVISIDEQRLSMRQAVLRDSVLIVFTGFYVLFALGPVFSGVSPNSQEFENGALLFLGNATIAWLLLEFATMLTNDKRRAIHDFIAGSVVVRLTVPAPAVQHEAT